jgi:pilus assembly protein CpaE
MITVALAIEDATLLEEVHTGLSREEVRVIREQLQVSDISRFAESVRQYNPDVVFVDVGSMNGRVADALQALRTAGPQSFLVALNTRAEPQTLLDCFHAGANEYLVPPVADGIRNVLHKRLWQAGRQKQRGKVVAFLSAKGGCGATTVACHVAGELAAMKHKVLLADFDNQCGNIGFLLGVKSQNSLVDALRNSDRLDASYWKGLVWKGENGVDILQAPTSVDAKRDPSSDQVRRVLEYARGRYPWTLLDLGRGLTPATLFALEAADEFCLVIEPNIPALHQAKTISQTLLDSGYPSDRLRVILNRVARRPGFDADLLRQALNLPIFAAVKQEDGESGDGLLPTGSELARQIGRLTRKLTGDAEETKPRFAFFSREKLRLLA